MSLIPRINFLPSWIRKTAAVPDIDTDGLEMEIAGKLCADDNEFLACSVLQERKHISVLAALLGRNEINKVSVAAYLNPSVSVDAKAKWIETVEKGDVPLAEVLVSLSSKLKKMVTSDADQKAYDLFHAAMTGIMTYLTKYSTTDSLQKAAVSPPGWEGTVKKMKEEDDIDNPWALSWWMKGKGYKSRKHKKKKS